MTTKELLFAALIQSKKDENQSRNSNLPKGIASLLNIHFKSKDMLVQTTKILNTDTIKTDTSIGESTNKYKTWEPGKKYENEASKAGKSQQEVVAVKDEDNDPPKVLTLSDYTKMDSKELLESFGTCKNIKEFAKDIGLKLDYAAKCDQFISDFEFLINNINGEEEEE